MSKTTRILGALGVLALTSGSLLAANMAFRFVRNLSQPDPALFTLSLPYKNHYTDARSLCRDLGTPPCARLVHQFVKPGSTVELQTQTWNGATSLGSSFGIDFPIVEGEGYLISSQGGPVTNWVISGTHDPTFVKNFSALFTYYLVSIPYHTTAANAHSLCQQIPNGCGQIVRQFPKPGSPGVMVTQSWLGATTLGSSFGVNFPVIPGEAYLISAQCSGPGCNWFPPHY